jgi:hypothetical protein
LPIAGSSSKLKMELPPGWRGYRARDHIDHPDTARRVAEAKTAGDS